MNSITRAKTLLDTVFYRHAEPFLANIEACEQVMRILEDEPSRIAYEREIAHEILLQMLPPDSANALVGGFSEEALQGYLQETRQRLADGLLPRLCYAAGSEELFIQAMAAAFVIEQYRYPQHVDIEPGDVFLDCGACYGESALWALSKGAERVYSFEILPEHIESFKQNRALFAPHANLYLIDKGVANAHGVAKVQPMSAATRLVNYDADSDLEIETVDLDSFCADNNIVPTFIKMDIEGAEVLALQGAAEIIRTYRPKLAICLYHAPAHRWQIPLLIKSLVPEYRLFFKKNHTRFEDVLYATI